MKNYFCSLITIFNSLSNFNKKFYYKNEYLINTHNAISYESIYSKLNIPMFDNSAMDGFAYNFLNISKNDYSNVLYSITAGEFLEIDYLDYDYVIEIMTGSRIPTVFDSVIKFEDVILINKKFKSIKFKNFLRINKYDNIRFIGEDIKLNSMILEKGQIISISHHLLLSSIGLNFLKIISKPNLYILCTGNEINFSKIKNNYLKNVFISDSISFYVYNFFKFFDFEIYNIGTSKDKFKDFFYKIEFLLLSKYLSLLLTIGAVSFGILDFIPKSLKLIGSYIYFHKVKIKPGKPILFSKFGNYLYIFSLPGNPISSIIGIRFFVYPFLRFLIGLSLENPIKACLINDYNFFNSKKKNLFLKGFYYFKNSIIYVKILDDQESFKVNNMLISNCFIFLKVGDNSNNGDLLDIFYCFPNFLK